MAARTYIDELKFSVVLKLKSLLEPSFEGIFEAYIVPQVTTKLPSVSFERYEWPHLTSLPLADPGYHLPDRIDILLGADSLNVIMRDEGRRGTAGEPMAQSTAFGWVLSGPVSLKFDLSSSTESVVRKEPDKGGHNGGHAVCLLSTTA